ncbi:MAG: hypothetical protein ABJB74_16345 [Gemmatimonas sp.]
MPLLNWVLTLGACGLVAGIWGPIRFNPQFQMGPLIGVFMTGPLGAILGVAGYFISRWMHWPMPVQWRVIAVTAVLLVAGTILSSFPAPEFKAFIVNSTVVRCRPVSALRDELLAHWKERVDNIKSTEPAVGWPQQMATTVQSAQGFVIDVHVVRRTEIRVNRKPWNRGTLVALDRTKPDETTSYFDDSVKASCANYVEGKALEIFVDFASRRRVTNSQDWPPTEIDRIVDMLPPNPVPAEYQRFARSSSRQ